MLKIIPAIDIIDGKCVRLKQGDYSQKSIYSKEPLEMAKQYADLGFERLHLVDLDGAKSGKPVHLNILEQICTNTSLSVDYGGGIKSKDDLERVLESGAAMANIGSLAVKNPSLFKEWLIDFGSSKILLASDVKDEKVAINAWQDSSEIHIFDFIEDFAIAGLTQFFCTDVAKDGLLEGTNLDLYAKLRKKFPALEIIASGGVAKIEELTKLQEMGIDGVIIGKAIYEDKISLKELVDFMENQSL